MTRLKPLDPYPRIWEVVSHIPKGKVASYGKVATLAGFPSQPRLAGYAMHNLPDGIDIPWHRVINAQGKISLPGAAGAKQRSLLEKEGVIFRQDRIDMEEFGWESKTIRRGRRTKPKEGNPARHKALHP